MNYFTKAIALAGLIAPLVFSTQAAAQFHKAQNTNEEQIEAVAISFKIDQFLTERQSELSTNLTNIVNAKVSARIEKIQNEPVSKDKPILVLASVE